MTRAFAWKLARSFPRVPFLRDCGLFREGMELGQRLIAGHSFQERYPGDGSITIHGSAVTIEKSGFDPQSRRLSLAEETCVAPVSPDAWTQVVSGSEVLHPWVKRRIGLPLTLEIQSQLIDVIWAREQTVNLRPALNDFGEWLLSTPHFSRQELRLG